MVMTQSSGGCERNYEVHGFLCLSLCVGEGVFVLNGAVEDSATAEISRSQVSHNKARESRAAWDSSYSSIANLVPRVSSSSRHTKLRMAERGGDPGNEVHRSPVFVFRSRRLSFLQNQRLAPSHNAPFLAPITIF